MVTFDYENQAWVKDGLYQRCGHPDEMGCKCYGTIHEGEKADVWEIFDPRDGVAKWHIIGEYAAREQIRGTDLDYAKIGEGWL